MRKLLALLLFLCMAAVVQAQDVIVKKDGSTIVCRVVELNATEIVYKKWGELNGSNYIMDRSLAASINYENGRKEDLSEVRSQYTPGNQSDGVRQMNDQALLGIDYATNTSKKVKSLRIIGWTGGVILEGIAAACFLGHIQNGEEDWDEWSIPGTICCVGGIVWTSTFLITANRYKRQGRVVQANSIYQQEFKLSNGTSLTAGVDLLKDNMHHNQTLGLGLRYSF